jgi:uncharacterized protein YycO
MSFRGRAGARDPRTKSDVRRVRLAVSCVAVGMALTAVAVPVPDGKPLSYDLSILQSGDLLFVRGKSLRSLVVLLLESAEGDLSHVGIVWLQDGMPYVVHASPVVEGVGRQGGAVIQPVAEFLSPRKVSRAVVYRLAVDSTGTAVAAGIEAKNYTSLAIPFDHELNLASSDKLYCTELVWRAYKKAGLDLLKPDSARIGSRLFGGRVILPSALARTKHLKRVAVWH